jgi:hypothetical protein
MGPPQYIHFHSTWRQKQSQPVKHTYILSRQWAMFKENSPVMKQKICIHVSHQCMPHGLSISTSYSTQNINTCILTNTQQEPTAHFPSRTVCCKALVTSSTKWLACSPYHSLPCQSEYHILSLWSFNTKILTSTHPWTKVFLNLFKNNPF